MNFFAREGDIFVFTPPSQLVVYRNGGIEIQMSTSRASIDGLCIAKILKKIGAPAPIEEPVGAPVVVATAASIEDLASVVLSALDEVSLTMAPVEPVEEPTVEPIVEPTVEPVVPVEEPTVIGVPVEEPVIEQAVENKPKFTIGHKRNKV